MAKRIPVKVSVTTRQMTPDEEVRFMTAIDALIGELVEREVDRRIAERRAAEPPTPPDGSGPSAGPVSP
jgi:hypothetical protein